MDAEQIKNYLDTRFDQLLNKLATKDDIAELRNEVTSLISDKIEAQGKQISFLEVRVDELEAENAVLKSHVTHLIASHESQEQYSRRLCLRIDGMPPPSNGEKETSEDCLTKVKEIFEEIDVQIPDAVIDRAHRIGPKKIDKGTLKQQVIVRFTTWRHRTAVYRARKKASNVKFRLDLTKKRLELLNLANLMLKPHKDCYAFADVNCRIRAKIKDKYVFLDSVEELEKTLTTELPSDDELSVTEVVGQSEKAEES